MTSEWGQSKFSDLYQEPSRNGISVPKALRGTGAALVNMRELFAMDSIGEVPHAERVPLPEGREHLWELQDGDLLFGRRSLVLAGAGRCALVRSSGQRRTFESSLIRVRLDPTKADPRFYFYYFRSPMGLRNMATIVEQVAVAGIRSSDLGRLSVPLPSLDVQRRIAGVLGRLDDLIDTNWRLVSASYELAEVTWQQHFGGVEQRFELGDVASVVLGGTPSRTKERYWGGDIPWLNSSKANELIIVEPSEFVTQEGYDSSSTKMMPAGSTVIAITGATLGQIARTAIHACGNQSLVGVYCTNDAAMNDYLHFAVSNRVHDLLASASGGAQQHINKGNVERLLIARPDARDLREWHTIAGPLLDLCQSLSHEMQEASKARDELLPLLMSGRVVPGEVA